MKTKLLISWWVVCLVLLISTTNINCTEPNIPPTLPEKALYIAGEAYVSVMDTLTVYRNLGYIDDEMYNEIEKYRVIVRGALDSWRIAIDSNLDPEEAITMFSLSFSSLLLYQTQLDKLKGGL